MSHDGRDGRRRPDDQLALDDIFCNVADEKFIQEMHTFRRLSGYETSSINKPAYDEFGLDDGSSVAAAEKKETDSDDGALPYSKARCIALVTTAVGASFTAVSAMVGMARGSSTSHGGRQICPRLPRTHENRGG